MNDGLSVLGKITSLLLGYNIVDNYGNVIRKGAFVGKYPEKAQRLADELYDKYNNDSNDPHPYEVLNREVYSCIGFNISPSKHKR